MLIASEVLIGSSLNSGDGERLLAVIKIYGSETAGPNERPMRQTATQRVANDIGICTENFFLAYLKASHG